MRIVKWFIAGFIATLIFHQGLLGLLYLAGISPRAPFNLAATSPLGIPEVLSLAFWGGVWAVALAPLLAKLTASRWGLGWMVAGAIGPSAVALFIVFPLKGMPMAGGWDPKLIIGALLLNGAWGLGCAVALRLMRSR
ncbi:hypothetical protein [Silanimonas sp.]|uniref:hypothetical protein n=1 Tax=Silanimonas sp. TaxID=1929290 RepID=UPI0022BBD0FF|nr:hypothetical protein [Silanimonas sp.]MCZ8165654.1 hypothetical protein [Silanimonas sp.]